MLSKGSNQVPKTPEPQRRTRSQRRAELAPQPVDACENETSLNVLDATMDATEINFEFVPCSDDQQMEAINEIDNNALDRNPLNEISQIELNPPSAEILTVKIISNDSLHSTAIREIGKFDIIIFIVYICLMDEF